MDAQVPSNKASRSGIKRLRAGTPPRSIVCAKEDIRVFYDVYEDEVVILAVGIKVACNPWLAQFGEEENETNNIVEVKDDLSRHRRLAADEEIVITRHGKPAGVLIGFVSEDDWIDYRLETDLLASRPDCASKRRATPCGLRRQDRRCGV